MKYHSGWWLKSILTLFLLSIPIHADDTLAVVRLPSHGASATIIATGPGYTWVLGCGHAYEGADRGKKMAFDIAGYQKTDQPCNSWLMDVNYKMDLSLVILNQGPLPYVCPIAPRGYEPGTDTILSVGFDEMKFPPHKDPAHIVSESRGTYYTREKPWHGRSGGGLLDVDKHFLIGVVQGYETPYKSSSTRGMYVSHKTICAFIDQYSQKRSVTPDPVQRLLQPLAPQCLPGRG